MTTTDNALNIAMHALVEANARSICSAQLSDQFPDPHTAVVIAYGVGIQFGLELSQLDLPFARRLIEFIHALIAVVPEDHNANPLAFIEHVRLLEQLGDHTTSL